MAIDWGAFGGQVLEAAVDWFDPRTTPIYNFGAPPAGTPGAVMVPPVGTGDPNYNGQAWARAQKCKRRRSRPMLTPTNMALMHQIGTLPNNANVRIALSKAIRKS